MNKFASFDISDAAAINAHFDKYPVAEKAGSFISNGRVLFQYDDGEDEPVAVQIVSLKEQVRAFTRNKAEIVHSNSVMDTLVADASSRVDVAQAEVNRIQGLIDEASSNRTKKTLRDELELADRTLKDKKGALHEAKSQKLLNEHEITRLDLNIELFRDKIAELSK